ncbi:MAG TPA: hypothetical protein VFV02_14500, partial [Acidimicrobiales bacterium]|nr:hypothetical protein [Acidimicrobiales bacterium]
PMLIDRRGFAEISELMTSVLERLFGLREECLARLGESGEPPRPAISNLLLFGLPPPRSGAAREPSSTP